MTAKPGGVSTRINEATANPKMGLALAGLSVGRSGWRPAADGYFDTGGGEVR